MTIAVGDIVDLLVRDDESLVLTRTHCLRLTEVPTAIALFLSEPRSLEDVASHLEERFGVAPDDRLAAILDDLAGQDVIRLALTTDRSDVP